MLHAGTRTGKKPFLAMHAILFGEQNCQGPRRVVAICYEEHVK